MQFPALLYRCPGPNQCQGGSFSHVAAADQAEYDQRITDGWYATVPDALNPPKPAAVAVAPVEGEDMGLTGLLPAVEVAPPEDNAAPTRAELEAKAAEMGIKVDGRWSDAKIASLIADELAKVA
jgi:hypothetical protein